MGIGESVTYPIVLERRELRHLSLDPRLRAFHGLPLRRVSAAAHGRQLVLRDLKGLLIERQDGFDL